MNSFVRLILIFVFLWILPYCSSVTDTNPPGDLSDNTETAGPDGNPDGSDNTVNPGSDPEDTPAAVPILQTSFDFSEGSSWPVPWVALNESGLEVFEIENEQGRLTGDDSTGYGAFGGLSRIYAPTQQVVDFEASFQVRFDNFSQQGVGFYGRHNGGFLALTVPQGQGYGVFLEGYSSPAGPGSHCLGFWYEINGVETQHHCTAVNTILPGGILDGEAYQIRYQVEQIESDQTAQRARLWPVGEAEPNSWHAEWVSGIPALQQVGGGFVIDLFNRNGANGDGVLLDDIVITEGI